MMSISFTKLKELVTIFFERIKQTKQPRPDNRIQAIIYHYFLKQKYPNLKLTLFYVNRKNQNETLEIPIEYTDEEIEQIYKKVCNLKESILENRPLKPIENIIFDQFEKRYIINPTAIICDYHAMCCGDDYWYPKTAEQIEKLNQNL